MSDFGAILKFQKKSGSISPEDKEQLLAEIISELNSGNYSGRITDSQPSGFQEWEPGLPFVILAEYYEDDYEEEMYEFIQDEDLGEAEKLAEALSEKLGEDYTVAAKLEDW